MASGRGADLFVFNHLGDVRSIQGFSADEGDRICLGAIDANATRNGNQPFRIVSAFTGHAGELLIGQQESQADVDGDGRPDFQLAVFGGQPITADAIVL